MIETSWLFGESLTTRGAVRVHGLPWRVVWESAGQNFESRRQPWHPTERYPPIGESHGCWGRTRRSGAGFPVRLTSVADGAKYPWAALLLIRWDESLRIRRDAGRDNHST